MINWIITFFILAILAAFFGFGGMAASFASVAKLLTAVFVVLFLGSLVYSLLSGGRKPPTIL
jgi:uncharacterized membrane protein YtjA (UPF0391 family)